MQDRAKPKTDSCSGHQTLPKQSTKNSISHLFKKIETQNFGFLEVSNSKSSQPILNIMTDLGFSCYVTSNPILKSNKNS